MSAPPDWCKPLPDQAQVLDVFARPRFELADPFSGQFELRGDIVKCAMGGVRDPLEENEAISLVQEEPNSSSREPAIGGSLWAAPE